MFAACIRLIAACDQPVVQIIQDWPQDREVTIPVSGSGKKVFEHRSLLVVRVLKG
jgi:hypothetical protein